MAHLGSVTGALTRTREFRDRQGNLLTDAQVRTLYLLYIQEWASPMPEGLTNAQQNAWIADQVLAKSMGIIYSDARKQRVKNRAAERVATDAADDLSLGL